MINQKSNVRWTSYLACGAIEGFESVDAHEIEAWAFLIKTGRVWQLQGFYGRTAHRLIQDKFVSPDGVIDWEMFEE